MADDPVVTGKKRLHRQLQIKVSLPLAMVVALKQQPHIEHNAVVLAVVGYATMSSRKPIGAAPTGGTTYAETHNSNASRSSGEGVWGRGASLREAASPPESPI